MPIIWADLIIFGSVRVYLRYCAIFKLSKQSAG